MLADVTVASERATFRVPELFRGIADTNFAELLPRQIGPARARDLLLTGRTLSGAEAADWGLVARVAPHDAVPRRGARGARLVRARRARGPARGEAGHRAAVRPLRPDVDGGELHGRRDGRGLRGVQGTPQPRRGSPTTSTPATASEPRALWRRWCDSPRSATPERGWGQRPWKSGSRLLAAGGPYSWKSSLRLESSIASASSARWRSRSTVRLRCTSSFVSPTATVAAAASSVDQRVGGRRRRRPPATARWTRPHSAACVPADLAAEQEHLLGPGHADEPRDQPRRARVGREADRRERGAEPGVVGDDREVGREHEVEPEPDRRSRSPR